MEDFGVIAYIIAAVVYTIYRGIRKSQKKKQGAGKTPSKQSSPQRRQTQQESQPGKSLDDILKELYPETKQKQQPQQQPPAQAKVSETPLPTNKEKLNKRIREAERLLRDPSKRRIDTPDINWLPPVQDSGEEAEIDFDLRQAIIAKVILDRPYK